VIAGYDNISMFVSRSEKALDKCSAATRIKAEELPDRRDWVEEVKNVYAIIQTGGKQYKVAEGEELNVDRLAGEAGDTVTFDQVLYLSGDNAPITGKPFIEGASVSASVVEHGKGDKVVIFKYKAKKDYRKKQGHRQPYTRIRINSFTQPEKKEV
jgi:large subunit ribosomal protein L21